MSEFHTWHTMYSHHKPRMRGVSLIDYYDYVWESNRSIRDQWGCVRAALERDWYAGVRPYYKVWPGFAESLLKVSLDCPAKSLGIGKLAPILVRYQVGKETTLCNGASVRCVLLGTGGYRVKDSDEVRNGLFVLTDVNDHDGFKGGQLYIDLEEASKTISNAFDAEFGLDVSPHQQIAQIAISIILLSRDPEFIKPDVLAADRIEYDRTHDPKLVENAREKGVVGWRIGESYETTPHLRRPHLGLRWTGPGGEVPKIVPIKGSIVHRDRVSQVPTGYITPQGVEVEV